MFIQSMAQRVQGYDAPATQTTQVRTDYCSSYSSQGVLPLRVRGIGFSRAGQALLDAVSLTLDAGSTAP
ncbi:MAG: hypothetical protein R3F53_24540 [Gammaproteobacteria bacterium]